MKVERPLNHCWVAYEIGCRHSRRRELPAVADDRGIEWAMLLGVLSSQTIQPAIMSRRFGSLPRLC